MITTTSRADETLSLDNDLPGSVPSPIGVTEITLELAIERSARATGQPRSASCLRAECARSRSVGRRSSCSTSYKGRS
jgi:hypothetical protein